MKHGLKRVPLVPDLGPIGRFKALMRAPSVAKLVWALFQDPRVPVWQKAGVLTALVVVVSPIDVLQAIPIVGEISDIVMALFILDTFIKVAPGEVVNEHIVRLNLQSRIPLRG